MPVDSLRIVTDRWEWDSLAQLAPTIYHEQSWTLASVQRIKTQTSTPVRFGYARVWVADTLVGCPLIRQGDRPWYNSPRAAPLVLQGTRLNAPGAVMRAIARSWAPDPKHPDRTRPWSAQVALHDDSELVHAIERARLSIEVRSSRWRRYKAMSGREIDEMVRTLRWKERPKAREWGDALRTTWTSGCWTTEVHVHFDDNDRIVGYLVWVTRPGRPGECIAAALVGQRTPAWTVSR